LELSSWKLPMSERPTEMRIPSQRLMRFHTVSSLNTDKVYVHM
jgi:hypothetical protein